MPALVAGIHVFLRYDSQKTWMAGSWASGSDAVLRTAMPGHDDRDGSVYIGQGDIEAPMAKPGFISAKPLSVLLRDVFSDAYAKQGFAARELVTRWAEIAGSEIAAHSEPLKMQWPRPVEGQPQEPATLVLRVEGPMALEIQHSSDVILQRVNRF